jgi:putative ABC transport system substrate-binding protein
MPVIGLLGSEAPDGYAERLNGYRRGLQEAGYTEGKNVTIEYRWAEGHNERLSALADEFVRRRVAVVAALGTVNTAIAAKTATTAIPVVFLVGEDPVRLGLLAAKSTTPLHRFRPHRRWQTRSASDSLGWVEPLAANSDGTATGW